MAFVMLAPSVPASVALVCSVATAIALIVLMRTSKRSVLGHVMVALLLAGVGVVISDEVCQAMPWILECWCKWCA